MNYCLEIFSTNYFYLFSMIEIILILHIHTKSLKEKFSLILKSLSLSLDKLDNMPKYYRVIFIFHKKFHKG